MKLSEHQPSIRFSFAGRGCEQIMHQVDFLRIGVSTTGTLAAKEVETDKPSGPKGLEHNLPPCHYDVFIRCVTVVVQ